MYAYNPSFTWDVDTEVPEGGAPAAHERATTIKAVRDELAQCLWAAGEYQTKYYNQRHKPRHFNVGDEVLLSSKNIRLARPSKKLDNHFLGPFKILEVVGKQAYCLELAQTYNRIHPVFHVSLLEPYQRHAGEEPSIPPPAILLPDGEEWEVEKILDECKHYKKTHYLVKWHGFPDHENSWEKESDLRNCKDLLEEFRN